MKITDLVPNISEAVPYGYEKIKCSEYDSIIAKFLKDAKTEESPTIINMGGIPGAGKSTFYKNNTWIEHVFVDCDKVMEEISGYRMDIEIIGPAASFKKWEIPARVITFELIRQAVTRKCNIFFDNGGLISIFAGLLENIKKFGYTTEMHFIICDIETAFARTVEREKLTFRHTPRQVIENRNSIVDDYLNKYSKMVDVLYVYDSTYNRFDLKQKYANQALRKSA